MWIFTCVCLEIWAWTKPFYFITTKHKDLSERLRQIDRLLYEKVRLVLEQNKAERHLRGGDATRRKYLHAGTHVPEERKIHG